MEETPDQRIARPTEEFRKLLEEKFPEKGSTMQRIEELTEEIDQAIDQGIEDDVTKQEIRGWVTAHSSQVSKKVAVFRENIPYGGLLKFAIFD